MRYYSFYIYCAFLLTVIVFNQVSTLNHQGIVGGVLGSSHALRYAALIQGRVNSSLVYEDICSGIVIGWYHLLSAAECFVDKNNALIPKSYSVLAGAHLQSSDGKIRTDVVNIYLPGFEPSFESYNLAVLQVIDDMRRLMELNYEMGYQRPIIPKHGSPVMTNTATVYGYGIDKFVTTNKTQLKDKQSKEKMHELRFVNVDLVSGTTCRAYYSKMDRTHQLCGKMINDAWETEKTLGATNSDRGAPLIKDDIVIGILGKISIKYGEEIHSLYNNVAAFSYFINLVTITGKLPPGSYIHQNLRHEM